jgi:hypothetical protein
VLNSALAIDEFKPFSPDGGPDGAPVPTVIVIGLSVEIV